MASYFAAIMPAKEGGYVVCFPDIPMAFTQGETLEECLLMGADVLAVAAEEYAKTRQGMPEPSSLEQVEAWARAQKDDPTLNPSNRCLIQLFRAPDIDATPVRVTVSFAKSVLAEIDAKAKQGGFTRSAFLAHAAMNYSETPR